MSLFSSSTGTFVKWDEPKVVAGTIRGFRMGTDANDNPAVVIDIEDNSGDEQTITVAQANLKRGIGEAFGEVNSLDDLAGYVGDKLAVEFTHTEKLDGNRTLKHFKVEHKAAAASAPTGSLL